MKKIPVTPLAETGSASHQPVYLLTALETLLLGGIWSFVLLMLPVIQQLEQTLNVALLPAFAKAFGIVNTLLPLWIAVLHWLQRSKVGAANAKAWILLFAISLCGVVGVCLAIGVFSNMTNVPYLLALQAILALAYFMAGRGQHDAE